MPNTVTVTGSLYDARTGNKITSGAISVTPKNFIPNGRDIMVPTRTSYVIPGTGNISMAIAPSNGVDYVMEFDPNPADTVTPLELKAGYFSTIWTVGPNYQWTVATTPGLAAYWTLGEAAGTTAFDIGAGAHNGTYSGGFTLLQASGLADGSTAALFNGTTGGVTVADTADLHFGTASFSVEAWLKLPAAATDPGWAFGKGTPYQAVTAGWALKCSGTGTTVPAEFHLSDGVVAGANPPGTVNTSAQPLTLSRQVWHHLVFVVDRPNAVMLGYLDGALVFSNVAVPGGFGSVTNTSSVTLGKATGFFLNGTLDEVALYTRVLSATEVAAHYNFRLFASVNISTL